MNCRIARWRSATFRFDPSSASRRSHSAKRRVRCRSAFPRKGRLDCVRWAVQRYDQFQRVEVHHLYVARTVGACVGAHRASWHAPQVPRLQEHLRPNASPNELMVAEKMPVELPSGKAVVGRALQGFDLRPSAGRNPLDRHAAKSAVQQARPRHLPGSAGASGGTSSR